MKNLASIQRITKLTPIERADAIETGFIYKITNSLNNKIYIGKSTYKNIKKLIVRYKREILYPKPKDRYIIRAMKKYGIEVFKFEIIESNISFSNLNDKEIFYIEHFNTYQKGYNLTIGGEGTKGYKWSDEVKAKFSEKTKGRYIGSNNPFFNKKHSIETINKVIESNKRRKGCKKGPLSEETKQKISKSLKGKVSFRKGKTYDAIKGINNHNYKEVDMDKLKKLLDEGFNCTYICKELNISQSLFYQRKSLICKI